MIYKTLNKLSPEVVNQIAAGEVIERPSSVVKELVDNSIDADSTKIVVKVKNGGIDLIDVSDNGYGIPRENISSVFEAHTTSKIKDIDDLNSLISMGFRGEALSTITSVAKVQLDSKYIDEEKASSISFDENGISEVVTTAKELGTTIKVENIFYNIPARKKYLKTESTEFRKIYEMLKRYFLIYPNIHFILEKDSKIVEDIQLVKGSHSGEIASKRVEEILGKEVSESMLALYYEGAGIKINGYIAHPSTHKSKTSQQYIFLNKRPITDRGIAKAILEGYSRYLPFGEKVDFVINIDIKPELVDINVHPRKEEVRFENPYRVFSAVEEAVRHTLEKNLSYKNVEEEKSYLEEKPTSVSNSNLKNNFASIRERFNSQKNHPQNHEYEQRNIYFGSKSSSVKDSLLFSSELLKNSPVKENVVNESNEIRTVSQIFNKYIIAEYTNETVWVVDQHAAAERINFERLLKREDGNQNLQNLLVPVRIRFSKEEILFLEESKSFFNGLGFSFDIEGDFLVMKTIPAEYAESDFEKLFLEIFALEDEISLLKKTFEKRKNDILATIACHGSVRSGQKLEKEEMLSIIKQLKECDNPYSCPHGRPAVWQMSLSDIDSHFERTY